MHHGNIAALGLLQREIRQNFVGRQDPIHRYRVATLRRATQPQRSVSIGPATHLNLPAGDNLAADQTVTFLIQSGPWPKLIEPSQHFELIFIR